MSMSGLDIVRGLIERGYSPHHAAALAGHIQQESGFNPSAVNSQEGANGLLQWRESRWQGLQDYAKSVGKSPNDRDVQLDFIGREFAGPEKRAGSAFLAAPDVAAASAALKPYIRFGDNSAETRLANAQGLLKQWNGGPVGALAGPASASAGASIPAPVVGTVAPDAQGAVMAAAPASATGGVGALADPYVALGKGMSELGKGMQEKVEFLPASPITMPQSNIGQSQQIAAALAKAYGLGGM